MRTATPIIEMKVETMIIGTKIVSINQVLIPIRLNPMARIKQNAQSSMFSPHGAIVFRVFLL